MTSLAELRPSVFCKLSSIGRTTRSFATDAVVPWIDAEVRILGGLIGAWSRRACRATRTLDRWTS